MAKQIKRSEIAEKDLYKEIRDSAKKTIVKIDTLNKELKETAQVLKSELNQPLQKTLSGLGQLESQVTKMNTAMSDSVKLDKAKADSLKAQRQAEQEIYKIEQQRQRAIQQKMNTQKKERVETERLQKAEQKRSKTLKDQNNAYKQLVIATRDQKNESKRLGAELLKLEQSGKKNTKEYRKLSKEFRAVTKSAQAGDRQLKKLDQTVGDNFRNVGNYGKALGKLKGAFASLGLAMGGAMIIRDVFNVIKDFDQAQANLASVLGVSRDEMSALTEQSKELGATTRFTASQVSELQLEFAKLGFTQKEIEGMTGATLDLAGATGSELGETASIVGATMRGFGLDVSETQRVTDVMSKSFSTSSLDMSKFATAMASVAPVAKLSGKTIEQTTALISTLSDRGIDASTAGTGLRNMFLKANKAGLTFDEALVEINTSTDQVGTAMELFGTRGATLGVILANNTEDTLALHQANLEAEGSTKTMADMQLNTLGGALDLLRSAWEGYILKINEAGGVGEKFKNGIMFIANNFDTITTIIGKVVRAFVAYKVAMVGMKVVNMAMSTSFKDIGNSLMRAIPLTKAYKLEQQKLATATKGAGTAVKGLGGAIAGMGIGLAIGLVIELATAWYDVASGNAEARRQTDLYNKAVKEGEANGTELIETENKAFNEKMRQINLKARVDKANAKTSKEQGAIELARVKELTAEQEKAVAVIQAQIDANSQLAKDSKSRLDLAKNLPEKIRVTEWHGNSSSTVSRTNKARLKAIDSENKAINTATAENLKLQEGLKTMQNALQEFVVQGIEAEKDYSVNVKDNTRARRDNNTEFRRSIDLLKEKNALLENEFKTTEDIAKLTNSAKIKDQDKIVKDETKAQSEALSQGQEFDNTKLKEAIAERERLQIEGVERTAEYIKATETRKLEERFRNEREKINDQYAKLLAQDKLRASEKKKIEANLQIELDAIDEAEVVAKKSLAVTTDAIDTKTNLKIVEARKKTTQQLIQIEDVAQQRIDGIYNRREKEYKLSLLKSKIDTEDISDDMLAYEITNLEKKIEEYKKAGLDVLDLELALAEKMRQSDDNLAQDQTDSLKERTDEQIQVVQAMTDIFVTLADKRIKKIDEEINASKKRYDNYVELAKSGNITAKESMAVEAKMIAEQTRLKEKEEKRKQRIQLASSVLQTYMTNSADPDVKNPLAKTITDTVLLTEFIKNLPAFFDGTEDTGSNGKGVDGKGGFNAVLHPNERVMTKKQNALVGDMSNEDLSQLAYNYQNGMITNIGEGAVSIAGAWQSELIVQKLDSLERTLKNKPETNIQFEEIIGGVMALSRQTTTGNSKTFNRYRVK